MIWYAFLKKYSCDTGAHLLLTISGKTYWDTEARINRSFRAGNIDAGSFKLRMDTLAFWRDKYLRETNKFIKDEFVSATWSNLGDGCRQMRKHGDPFEYEFDEPRDCGANRLAVSPTWNN